MKQSFSHKCFSDETVHALARIIQYKYEAVCIPAPRPYPKRSGVGHQGRCRSGQHPVHGPHQERRLVGNLQKTDFTIFEDGKQQDIKYFTRETDLPLTIGLLVDTSGSQANLIDTERRAASEFFRKVLRPKDMAFLMQFGAEAELLQDSTNSISLLQRGLNQLRLSTPVGGLHPGPVPTASRQAGTILFDAVYLAADEKLKREVGRKAIVIITDGVDTGSRVSKEKAIEYAQKADAIIYSIEYEDHRMYGAGLRHHQHGRRWRWRHAEEPLERHRRTRLPRRPQEFA
jgi:VWFA-related protein